MTDEDITAATRIKLAEVLPGLLQATIDEYVSHIKKPSTDMEDFTFAKKQSSGKAAAGHIILLLKLANDVGLDKVAKSGSENLAKAIAMATQEYEKYKSLEDSDEFDDDFEDE